MDYIGAVSELNYLSQIVIMLYEDPTKDPSSDNRCDSLLLSFVIILILVFCTVTTTTLKSKGG